MRRTMLKSKIHRARVTEACVDYEGSISIDSRLLEEADMIQYERVDIYNVSNGERFSTYIIDGPRDSGVICLNGAAARKVSVGDLIIICTYSDMNDEECRAHKPKCVFVDEKNSVKKIH
jgi:aspartate 1-decarboxylase